MKEFSKEFAYLDTKELIEYFAVFEGFENLKLLTTKYTLLENVKEYILKDYHNLKKLFIFSDDPSFQKDIEKFLYRLAIGSGKSYSVYKKDISFYRGKSIYKILFQNKILKKEYSREEKDFKVHKRRKKAYRGYQIEDKMRFTKGFYRFWFMFIYPYKDELESKNYQNAYENIKKNLDHFMSLNFEHLSNELLAKKRKDIVEYGSYWDKYIELDLMAKDGNGTLYVGECKWKNHKVNTSILNKLKKKSAKVGLDVDFYVLFSKSGFSNELLKLRDSNLLLFNIDDFKELF